MTVPEQERAALVPDRSPEPAAPTEAIVRPAPHRWVWYAFGGGLPERHRGWVLYDTTTGTWGLRHFARALVQLAVPIALIVVFLPGPFWIRGMAALGGLLLGMFFSLAWMGETTESRVKRAGYPVGTAEAMRERAALHRQQRETQRKRAAAAKRAARYRDRTGR